MIYYWTLIFLKFCKHEGNQEKKKCNSIVDLSKFTSNKKILSEVITLIYNQTLSILLRVKKSGKFFNFIYKNLFFPDQGFGMKLPHGCFFFKIAEVTWDVHVPTWYPPWNHDTSTKNDRKFAFQKTYYNSGHQSTHDPMRKYDLHTYIL